MMQEYKEDIMNDQLYDYIMDNFNISADHARTLKYIYSMMGEDCHTLTTCDCDPSYLVPNFWYDFLKVCNAGSIDLTEEELLRNAHGALKRSEYYS